MTEYLGTKGTAASSVTGLFYGNPHQFVVQLEALLVIAGYDALATWGILKLIQLVVPLRYPDSVLAVGDRAIVSDVEVATEDGDSDSVLAGQGARDPVLIS
jgi:Amt family ammonium transporter